MAQEFRIVLEEAAVELFHSALVKVLEGQGYQQLIGVGRIGGERVQEYRKNDELISIHSSHRPEGQRLLSLHSETVDLQPQIALAAELSAELFLGSIFAELTGSSIHRMPKLRSRLRRIVLDALAGRL